MFETVNSSERPIVASEEQTGAKSHPTEPHPEGRDDVGRLLMVMNAALIGVPSAYAVSNSLAVTAMAASLAGILVVAYLVRRRQ